MLAFHEGLSCAFAFFLHAIGVDFEKLHIEQSEKTTPWIYGIKLLS